MGRTTLRLLAAGATGISLISVLGLAPEAADPFIWLSFVGVMLFVSWKSGEMERVLGIKRRQKPADPQPPPPTER